MDIAIGGLIILFLLLPGICFNRGYFSGAFSNQYIKNDFFGVLISALIPSLVIFLIFYLLLCLFTDYFYDFKILFGLFSSDRDIFLYSIGKISEFSTQIIIFNVVVNISSFVAGFYIKDIVIKKQLDTRYSILRYKNYWYYLISGRFMNFPESSIQLHTNTIEDVDITYIDALVYIGGVTYIYTGILVDYHLGRDGGLDLLIIKDAQRKKINEVESHNYKDIDGHIIVLKYSDLINVNFNFIQVEYSMDDENMSIEKLNFKLIN